MKSWIVLTLFIFTTACFLAKAKDAEEIKAEKEVLDYAYSYLHGVEVPLDYGVAYRHFRMLAESENAEAYNALGMMYKQGLGVRQNDRKAMVFFKNSAKRGYLPALYNVGLMHKYGHGVEQNYRIANKCFDLADSLGFQKADYAIAYSYNKGQGRRQNYEKAMFYYQRGADKGNPACMFSLGYNYLKGRGAKKDPHLGRYWINAAADLGYNRAIDFISYYKGDHKGNTAKSILQAAPVREMLPTQFQKVRNDSRTLDGVWEGVVVMYDWSGEEIESFSYLELELKSEGERLDGIWSEDGFMAVDLSASLVDSCWRFSNVILHQTQRELEMRSGRFRVEQKGEDTYLIADVTLYSLATKEEVAPTQLVLKKKLHTPLLLTSVDSNNQWATVYPNPFNEYLRIHISLSNPQVIAVALCDMLGRQIEAYSSISYSQGDHIIDIPAQAYPPGSYILRVTGDQGCQSISIIK